MENFKGIKYFSPTSKTDNWGDASKIDPRLLKLLDQLREEVGVPLIVTSGFREKDNGSQHQVGKAVDIVAPMWNKPLFDLLLIAERYPFTGIGVYPDWSYNGAVIGGLHLDIRDLKDDRSARWIGARDSATKKQVYQAMTLENLKALRVI